MNFPVTASLKTEKMFIHTPTQSGYEINKDKGDILVFASVGAGMNINALAYKI
ncbi:hypothetical protein ACKGJO_03410 [Gracilimonas sp. Q87]|uniref:hypothetical protein n=1 Tax=Gracilimonas sp. Q87 TaxID=3384766 RepID=UPI00398450F4